MRPSHQSEVSTCIKGKKNKGDTRFTFKKKHQGKYQQKEGFIKI